MRKAITTVLTVLLFHSVFGQSFISGNYSTGLTLCFDSATKKVSGYFEEYTGIDEQTNHPRFSCIFYMEGTVTGPKFTLKTYDPPGKDNGLILGTMEIVDARTVRIKLPEEHGGCWNVQHFADAPVTFTLGKAQKWRQIRYVETPRTYFYSDKADEKRLKSYLVQGNFVCVERIEGPWAYGTFMGKKLTKGWLKRSDLNQL